MTQDDIRILENKGAFDLRINEKYSGYICGRCRNQLRRHSILAGQQQWGLTVALDISISL